MRANTISLDKLLAFYYIDENHVLRHLKSRQGVTAHSQVGYVDQLGYLSTEISNKHFRVHRIIYQMIHELDTLPSDLEVDHIDLNPLNNNPDNLRLCEARENSRNRSLHKDNTSGYKGVYFDGRTKNRKKPWRAKITFNYSVISLGYFETKEEAHLAYQEASKKYHGEFGRFS